MVGYPYNPDKARQLLTEAGYPDGFDTKLIFFNTTTFSPLATTLAGYLEEVGIRAALEPQLLAQYDVTAGGGGWEEGICMIATYTLPEIMDSMQLILETNSTKFPSMQRPIEAENAFSDARAATDQNSKIEAIQNLQKIIVDDYCMATYLYVQGALAVKQSYVHDDMYLRVL